MASSFSWEENALDGVCGESRAALGKSFLADFGEGERLAIFSAVRLLPSVLRTKERGR